MMTTLRRQTASCLYGLAPFLRDMLAGKFDSLESTEEADGEAAVDPDFLAQVKADIEGLIERSEGLDPHDPKVQAFVKVLQDKDGMLNNKALAFSTFRHTLTYIARHVADAGLRFGLVHGGVPDEERSELRLPPSTGFRRKRLHSSSRALTPYTSFSVAAEPTRPPRKSSPPGRDGRRDTRHRDPIILTLERNP